MFGCLVRRYEPSVVAFLLARLDDGNEAAEAAQETFVRAFFALAKLRRPDVFASWLLGIAERVAKESRRQRRRTSGLEGITLRGIEARAESEPPSDRQLAGAVANLPEVLGEVVRLRFYDRKSCTEIARLKGVPLGTVTSRLSRAYSLLREALREGAGDSEG
jgi:RNA polymerase sigma-70 factor (ECF subfamily)